MEDSKKLPDCLNRLQGGGIYIDGGIVSITSSTISNNQAPAVRDARSLEFPKLEVPNMEPRMLRRRWR